MRLERWSIVDPGDNPYLAPELRRLHLQGKVFGHPEFSDGKHILTSPIVGKKGEAILTKSGSVYELGEAEEGYEAKYPNARQRVLESIK